MFALSCPQVVIVVLILFLNMPKGHASTIVDNDTAHHCHYGKIFMAGLCAKYDRSCVARLQPWQDAYLCITKRFHPYYYMYDNKCVVPICNVRPRSTPTNVSDTAITAINKTIPLTKMPDPSTSYTTTPTPLVSSTTDTTTTSQRSNLAHNGLIDRSTTTSTTTTTTFLASFSSTDFSTSAPPTAFPHVPSDHFPTSVQPTIPNKTRGKPCRPHDRHRS